MSTNETTEAAAAATINTADANDTIDTNSVVAAATAATRDETIVADHTINADHTIDSAAAAALIDSTDAGAATDTTDTNAATAAPTTKKPKRRRSGLSSRVRGNKQKRTTQTVQPNTKRTAASLPRRSVTKTKRNSNDRDDYKTIES